MKNRIRNFLVRNVRKMKRLLKRNPITYRAALACKRAYQKLRIWMKPYFYRELYTQEQLEAQRKATFPRSVTVSILVPLYNTPENYLREMTASVRAQTYGSWQLCLADGSDPDCTHVERICRELAAEDPRICYRRLEENRGISGNSNACIDLATGDYIALLDHDDILHPAALYEMVSAICREDADVLYTDEDLFRDNIRRQVSITHKPDFAPDTLRSYNYICHFLCFRRELLDKVGRFRPECNGSQDYDLVLRLTEVARKIVHIPIVLYHWRVHPGSVAETIDAKPYAIAAAKRALADHLQRLGLKGEVLDSPVLSLYRMRYEIQGEPLVSIVIPNCDHVEDLCKCLTSIFQKTTYPNYEIILAENNSKTRETFGYYDELCAQRSNVRVMHWDGPFNYSAINNYAAEFAKGEYLLLLNNDIEVISPDWIQEMLMYAQRSDVGAVGAKLYYPDDTVQHGGVILGIGGVAGHSHKGAVRSSVGYSGRLITVQNYSAVTAACMMLRRSVYEEVGQLDPAFAVAFNDVDLCMRIRKAGYLIVWTPFAELYHYESKSRGMDNTPEKEARFYREVDLFHERWDKELAAGDPYYNPNLTLNREDFSLR